MNKKRFFLASLVVFIFFYLYEWLLHGVCLADIYSQTASIWRPQTEMAQFMGWMILGQLLVSLMFCYIFVKGYEGRGLMEGVRYGGIMALLFIGTHLIWYAVLPISLSLMGWWVVGSLVESVIAGILVAKIYQPLSA